jgi:hypothetical protein
LSISVNRKESVEVLGKQISPPCSVGSEGGERLAGQLAGRLGDLDPELFGPMSQHGRGQPEGQGALHVRPSGLIEAEARVEFLGESFIHDEHGEEQGEVGEWLDYDAERGQGDP